MAARKHTDKQNHHARGRNGWTSDEESDPWFLRTDFDMMGEESPPKQRLTKSVRYQHKIHHKQNPRQPTHRRAFPVRQASISVSPMQNAKVLSLEH